ncbi:hypothetical protein JCM3775_002316 [Rhodotorula graminis]
MHHLESRDGPAAQHQGLHKRGMYKRQRVTTTTEAATTTTAARTTRRRATTTTAAATVLESAADLAATTSTSFQPGVAASGTATKSVGNAPPTRHRTLTSGTYTGFSFAAESSGLPHASAATADSSTTAAAATTGLPSAAIYGIAIGGGVLAVLVLAGIGICCWKKRKNGKKVDAVGGWTNLGDNGRGGPGAGQSRPVELSNAAAWASSDTLGAGGPYGADSKPWAQQSFSSLASHDEKGRGAHGHALPVFAPQTHDAARRELLGGPPARSATEQSFPRSATGASLASSLPPSGPERTRPATGAQSVNGVITFRGQQAPSAVPVAQPPPARLPSRPSPASSPTTRSTNVPLPTATPEQPPAARPAQPAHLSFNGVPVGPQPITTSSYPARRPSYRPSEVPSVTGGVDAGVPASPYAFARRPEQSQRDTQELASDERLEGRFIEVMTGQVGRDEQARARSKKDTIIGLTDAYGGEADSDDEDEERDHVVGLPSHPLPASTRAPAPSNPRRYSSRVDSKPLRELEAMFDQFPPRHQQHQHHGVRASEASDLSGLAAAAGVRLGGSSSPSFRTSDASSMYASAPPQHAPAVTVAPLGFARRALGPVPESDSKDSLSPLSAATATGSGAHSPYGATQRYEHSIYSASGEVGELSSNSIAASARSSPAKDASSIGQQQQLSSSQAPPGSSSGDVFGPATINPPARQSSVKGPALQRKVSTRPAAPAPLRLARNASLAHQQQPHPSSAHDGPSTPAAEDRRNPLTLSTAERDVLQQLGLPATPELSSSRDSARSSPSSVASSPSLVTPQTPVFHFSHPSTHSHPHDPTVRSFMDVSPSPSPSRDAFAQHMAPQIVVVDPVGAGGFDSLDVMAGKQGQQDASYRSATMSLYGMYE